MAEKKTIVRSDSLPMDRITSSFEDDYISCVICCNVLWKPIACQTCENAFCTNCIRLWLRDTPHKCPFQCRFQERKPPPILLKILSKLQLACRHTTTGCSAALFYEALEKHERQECDYRRIRCPRCSQRILQREFESHAANECPAKEVACLKCGGVYRQPNEQQSEEQYPQVKVVDSPNRSTVMPACHCLRNRPFRTFSRLFHFATSSVSPCDLPPVEEELMSRGSSGIFTINFPHMADSEPCGGSISNGYSGFNWENVYYTIKKYVSTNVHLRGFRMAFHPDQQYVAYNSLGAALTLSSVNPGQTFGLHSFEAIFVYHGDSNLFITAYRSNIVVDTETITVRFGQLKPFEMDLERVDRVVFKPEPRSDTFALSSLNLVL